MNDKHDEDLIKTQIQSGGPPNLSNAETLGHYKILRKLGQGGMGEVHLGYEESLRRYVAIKILPQFLRQDPELVERFFREAQAVAKLKHPGIVGIYYFGEDKGKYFFAMEYVDGIDLEDYVESRKTPVLQDILKIIRQSAEALKYASDQGVIHRDVKPSNIILDKEGNTHIADFGLAKQANLNATLTATGSVIGSPFYMSPEQAKGETVDFRADIYSLGCTFYYLLEGNPPFDANALTQVMLKHIQEPLPELTKFKKILDGKLTAVLQKMTQKNPNHRYSSYKDLLSDLIDIENAFTRGERIANPLPVIPQQKKLTYITPKKKSKLPKVLEKLLIFSILAYALNNLWNQYQAGTFAGLIASSKNLVSSSTTVAPVFSAPTTTHPDMPKTPSSTLVTPAPPDEQEPQPPDAPENTNRRRERTYTVAGIKESVLTATSQTPEIMEYIKNYDYMGAGKYLRSKRDMQFGASIGPLNYHLVELKRSLITAMNGTSPASFALGGQTYTPIGASEIEIQAKDGNQQVSKIAWKKLTPDQYYSLTTTYVSHTLQNDATEILFLVVYGLPQLDQELKSFEQTYHTSFESVKFSNPAPPPRPQMERD
jgi:serine/threonine protein kinase